MNPQRRRLNAESRALTTGPYLCELEFSEAPAVNAHGVASCFSIEPENTDANANGFWVLYCLPAGIIDALTDLPSAFSTLDNEDFLPYVWGVGCWTASNQAPYHHEFRPKTSRTCQKGARLVQAVVATGISAGNIRVNQTLTCFTTT